MKVVHASAMRDELMPGLTRWWNNRYFDVADNNWYLEPHICSAAAPAAISFPQALALGAVAAVIVNPPVTRRRLWDWMR